MKTKKMNVLMLCLVLTGFSLNISAQSHLDALIKKCETLKSIDMEVIKNKRETNNRIETKAVNIRITNDKKTVDEFLDAFKKDESGAEQAMFKKGQNSEINYYQCRFSNQTYTMVVNENGNANVTVNTNNTNVSFLQAKERVEMREQERELMTGWSKSISELTRQVIVQHPEQLQEHMKMINEQVKQLSKQNSEQLQERLKPLQEQMMLLKEQHQEQLKGQLKSLQEQLKEQHKEQIKQIEIRMEQIRMQSKEEFNEQVKERMKQLSEQSKNE